MPTDEQRMRREFEAWAEGVDLSPDFAAEREKCPDDPTHSWNYGKLTAWEAWQARDAEVQALRDENRQYFDLLLVVALANDGHGWLNQDVSDRIDSVVGWDEKENPDE